MGNTIRRAWTRNELLLAMNLYCRIPFGKQHSRAKEVIQLAKAIGRTPGSVAMKLNNLTSLDPEESERGVRGLVGVSALDRQVWEEFQDRWGELAAESEALWEQAVERGKDQPDANLQKSAQTRNMTAPKSEPPGPAETMRLVRVRRKQTFFRRTVLTAYGVRCCVSGNPVHELLEASHIVAFGEDDAHQTNPHNGICFSKLHHAAFDRHLITLDEDLRLVISKSLREYLSSEAIRLNFISYEGKRIALPERFRPDLSLLSRHRERFAQL